MDKLLKFLSKLSRKEQLILLEIIDKMEQGSLENLDIKKLKGEKDIYRIRFRKKRLLFLKMAPGKYRFISIENRSDTTYKF